VVTSATVTHLGFDEFAVMQRLHSSPNPHRVAMQAVGFSAHRLFKHAANPAPDCDLDRSGIRDGHDPPLRLLPQQRSPNMPGLMYKQRDTHDCGYLSRSCGE
jgi:hypothetical protein